MLRSFLYWIYQKRWLLVAVAVGTALYHLPYPEGISKDGYRTLILAIVVVILIISEAVPLPAIALFIAVLQVTFAIAKPSEVAQSYMSDAVFFIMGSLMLAVAIVRQGLDSRLTLAILTLTGPRVRSIMWGFFVISLLLTSFIGEHTVVAMLLPVALTLIRNTSDDPDKVRGLTRMLLFALAFGSIIGSIGTPSGGARNAIMINYLSDFGLAKISYLRWMLFTYPVLLIQIPLAGWLLSRAFKPEHDRLDSAVQKLKSKVAEAGPLTGQQILAIVLFVIIFLAWVFLSDRIGLGVIALAGVFLYLAAGLVHWQEINQRTNWGVVLLFAAAISLGVQLKNTGAALWVAQQILALTGGLLEQFAAAQYAVVVTLTTVVANIMSSSATVAVLGPLFMNFGGDPVLLGMATAVASAFGYLTTVGAPACMIIAATGLVSAKDFVQAGWRIVVVSIAVLMLALLLYWPHIR
ncbi:MAG: DASS family sodium-coupled anion symporter [Fidelibacterota bacterium]|nr:MAG: DASS family sodium-coupled anion symporter [Candidatus Neomarinimicrobiota bacterium]